MGQTKRLFEQQQEEMDEQEMARRKLEEMMLQAEYFERADKDIEDKFNKHTPDQQGGG